MFEMIVLNCYIFIYIYLTKKWHCKGRVAKRVQHYTNLKFSSIFYTRYFPQKLPNGRLKLKIIAPLKKVLKNFKILNRVRKVKNYSMTKKKSCDFPDT